MILGHDQALDAAASMALERETGARGLRAIIEGALLDVMYDIPSRSEIGKVIVTEKAIRRLERPELFDNEGNKLASDEASLPDAA